MPIEAKALKRAVLKPARKIGVVVRKNSRADQAITSTTNAGAHLFNRSEKLANEAAARVKSEFEGLRAKVHRATAPKKK